MNIEWHKMEQKTQIVKPNVNITAFSNAERNEKRKEKKLRRNNTNTKERQNVLLKHVENSGIAFYEMSKQKW